MDERARSNLAGLRRKAAEKTPYPYFLERLEEIDAWLKGDNPTRVGGRVRCGSVSLVMSSVASASGLTMYANLGEVVAQDDHE